LGGIVKGGKINYGELPPGWAQSLAQPTLATQMRATGELPPLQTAQTQEMSKGAKFGMGTASIAGNILGFMGGSALGSKLSGGNQIISMISGIVASQAVSSGLTKLISGITGIGTAANGAAGKTSLLTKTFRAFIGLPGPLKLLAVVVGVGAAIKGLNDKIEEHRRIISSGFGISEESAKKLGLQYKKLGSEIDTYQQKYDLMLAKAAANRFNQTKAEGKGINITVPELEKLKKQVAKDFPDEIKMFDKATNEEAIERATNLKAGMVATGKSVEEANEIILAMIMNSNKSAYALEILGDRGFGKIQGKISATNSTIKTFSNIIKEGNFDQLPIALQTSVNALDNLQKSFIKIDANAKKAITSSEAYEKVLNQISTTANKPIGEKGLEEILAQNEGLRDVITSTDTLAGIWAKIKLSTSGITFNLKDMSTETATAISLLLEQQKDYLATNDSLIGSAADLIAKTGNITANQLIKNANRTKESIQKEIELRQKNIQKIKDEADAKKRALEQETEAEDFLLQIQKKQIEYSEALASGDMARAAQAQLDIQSMTGARQLDLAKTAIDAKADKDIKKQQDLIDNLTKALDGLSKTLEKQISAAGNEQAKKADMQGLYDLFFQAVTLGMGGVTADEKLIIGDIAKQLTNSGIKEFVDLSSKYLQMSPTGPYVGRAQEMGFGALESLGAASFSVIAGKLQVEDTELSKYIKALANSKTGDSTTNFTPKLTNEKSAMGTKATYTITPQQYVDSGMYVQGEDPVAMKKTFIDYAGRRFKIVGKQEDGDYIVERQFAAGGIIKNFMPGGNVTGPGTGTSDSIPAMLSNGEYVIKAKSVQKYGIETFDALNSGRFANGGSVNASALITPSVPYYMNMGGMIPGYFDGGSVFSNIMNTLRNPLGAGMGIGLDLLNKIDTYRKNKDVGKWMNTGFGSMERKTVNPDQKTIYVYDKANKYDAKDRGPIVDKALEYLTGQTGVQFKRATFGMRNNPEVIKLNWADLETGIAGMAKLGSNEVTLDSPRTLNFSTLGRLGGSSTIAHEILHAMNIGKEDLSAEGAFANHAKNPFNLMFPGGFGAPQFISQGDTEQVRALADYYKYQYNPYGTRVATPSPSPGPTPPTPPYPLGKGLLRQLDQGPRTWAPDTMRRPQKPDPNWKPNISWYAMGGPVGYHQGGPVGHRHGRNAPESNNQNWLQKYVSKLTKSQKEGAEMLPSFMRMNGKADALGAGSLLRKLTGQGEAGDAFTAALFPLNFLGMGSARGALANPVSDAAAKTPSLLGAAGRALKAIPEAGKDWAKIGIYKTLGKMKPLENLIYKAIGFKPVGLTFDFKTAYNYVTRHGESYFKEVIDKILPPPPRPGTAGAPPRAPGTGDDGWWPTTIDPKKLKPMQAFGELAGLMKNKFINPVMNPIKGGIGKLRSVLTKENMSNILLKMSPQAISNILYRYTPVGSMQALRLAKQAGMKATSASEGVGLDLPIEELVKQAFYHGGKLPEELLNRLEPFSDKILDGNIFNFDLFTTMDSLAAREYAVGKNAEAGGSLWSTLFDIPENMSKVWDMRGGSSSLWSQSKGGYAALEKYFIDVLKMPVAEARAMLAGERVPGVARLSKALEDRASLFHPENLSKAFSKIGKNGPEWVIDTIAHTGGILTHSDRLHAVLTTLDPEKNLKAMKQILPQEDLRKTFGMLKEFLPSALERYIEQYAKSGKTFSTLLEGIWRPTHKNTTSAASGGYLSGGKLQVPKFENGINMVPADMLAMLHKNEAVVPANMNPFNPNAQSYSQPSISYNIAPVINAAPGMDEQAIANMATRQVLAEIKAIDSRNTASIGRQGMRVVGNK